MEVAIDAFNRRWQLKTTYHDAVVRFSPGVQLMNASIKGQLRSRTRVV